MSVFNTLAAGGGSAGAPGGRAPAPAVRRRTAAGAMRRFLVATILAAALSPAGGGAAAAATQDGAASDGMPPPAAAVAYLEQNWSEADRQWFYYVNQGSRLLSYDIFIRLERHDGRELLASPAVMMEFGFLPGKRSPRNPDALPIGVVRDDAYAGLTCAACHTQPLRYDGRLLHIDGGQALIDLPRFLRRLEQALAAVMEDEEKLQRLARRYYQGELTRQRLLELRAQVVDDWMRLSAENRRNHSSTPHGYGRLDAFGAILNKGLSLTGVKDNFNEPNAPTSYPYLWDTPQHDYVEWNGAQSNSNIGALARNVGEALGVYARVEPVPVKWLYFYDAGYASSVQVKNLRAIEKKVSELHSPLWPDFFPAIDRRQAQRGRELYQRYCIACHQDVNRTDPGRRIQVRMSSIERLGTDPAMAENVLRARGATGIFEGLPRFYSVGAVMSAEEPSLHVVNNLMGGVLRNNPLQSLLAVRDAKKMGHPEEIHPPKYLDGRILERGEEVSRRALRAYKARPLNGVWSSAPYLHNGSVQNLYELLLPAARRARTFYLGSWEFDPVRVGYVSRPGPNAFLLDAALPGNSNAGHEYGAGQDGMPALSEEEIWALLEYLKTL